VGPPHGCTQNRGKVNLSYSHTVQPVSRRVHSALPRTSSTSGSDSTAYLLALKRDHARIKQIAGLPWKDFNVSSYGTSPAFQSDVGNAWFLEQVQN
jgi:hypothetical protein